MPAVDEFFGRVRCVISKSDFGGDLDHDTDTGIFLPLHCKCNSINLANNSKSCQQILMKFF